MVRVRVVFRVRVSVRSGVRGRVSVRGSLESCCPQHLSLYSPPLGAEGRGPCGARSSLYCCGMEAGGFLTDVVQHPCRNP